MRDVSPGAVSREEHPAEIPESGHPRVGPRENPLDGGPAVIVGGGEGVFGGEAVVDGDDQEAGSGCEGGEVGMVSFGKGGLDAEGTAVEVE